MKPNRIFSKGVQKKQGFGWISLKLYQQCNYSEKVSSGWSYSVQTSESSCRGKGLAQKRHIQVWDVIMFHIGVVLVYIGVSRRCNVCSLTCNRHY